MKIRYGIRSLLVVCALVVAYFPFRSIYDHWFMSTYSGFHIHQTLGTGVHDGDSFEYVSSLFDRSELRSAQWVRQNAPVLASGKSIFADHKDGDTYHLFFINGGNVRALFQFRNGLVVNHVNGLYKAPYSQVRHYNDRLPSWLLRQGALPVYIMGIAVCGTIVWSASRFATRQKRFAG